MSLALVESPAFEVVPVPYPVGDRRSIDATGFTRLLHALHPDSDHAAREYERLRRALVKFFDWRGVSSPDECADDVFDRLARKLEETTVRDVQKYVHGIARLVALERRRGPVFESFEENPHVPLAAMTPADNGNPLHDCFYRCLEALPEESRSLLLIRISHENTKSRNKLALSCFRAFVAVQYR